ncbi:hypothetical protein FWK35_00003804 [Aphis craccivora]|uniref:Uncharacterized protein n=1 Tax=Aphis craccivora TaxID=307492 RepID=A0A6G0Z7W2_APHCR|nr:hypothetical protein FWK35_00003804 [Aphis craccivora]
MMSTSMLGLVQSKPRPLWDSSDVSVFLHSDSIFGGFVFFGGHSVHGQGDEYLLILERSHFLFVDFFLCCLRRICKLQPVVDVCTWDVKRCVMPMSGVSGPYIRDSVDGSPAM